jgi:lysylphosphatidylglycerol synthetase-like protein (DUF2156 family)
MPMSSAEDRAVVRALVDGSEDDPLAPFALHPEKRYIFSADRTAVLAFAVRLGVAVASGDPVGSPESWPEVIGAFLALCRRHRWRPAVLGAGERARPLWTARGLRAVPIGRDVVVRPEDWRLDGRRFRNLRQAVQRTRNAGVTTQLLREDAVPAEVVAELRRLRAELHGTAERGFSMILGGWFDGDRPDALLALARDRGGRLVAAQRYLPAGPGGLSLDVPLRVRNAPNGVDERLVADTVAWAGARGRTQVSLAFAPFPELFAASGAGPARLAAAALRVLDPFIGLRSLYQYLRKFDAFAGQRFVLLRLRSLPRAALAFLLLEFGRRPAVPGPPRRARTPRPARAACAEPPAAGRGRRR